MEDTSIQPGEAKVRYTKEGTKAGLILQKQGARDEDPARSQLPIG